MKTLKLRLFVSVFAVLFVVLSNIFVTAEVRPDTFHLAYDDYRPFHWYDSEEKKNKGLFIDLIEELLVKRLGIEVEYYEYSWARAQLQVKMGVDDAYISSPTPERLTYAVALKTPLYMMDKVLFTYVGHPKIEEMKKIRSLSELKPYKIVDYLGNGWSKQNLLIENNLDVEYTGIYVSVLKMLSKKRGDVLVDNPQLVYYNLRTIGLTSTIRELPVVFDTAPFTLCISKLSKFVTKKDEIEKAIVEMKADGTYEQIVARWAD